MRTRPSPQDIETSFRAAIGLHESGAIEQAEAGYRDVLAAQPENPGALFLLGLCHHQRGEHDTALRLMADAIAINPNLPQAHYNRGLALGMLGRHEEAVASHDRALALNPNYAAAHAARAGALNLLGRPAEALAGCDQALALGMAGPELLISRGQALFMLGRFEAAVDSFRRVLDLAGDHLEALNLLGAAYGELGRHLEALACFDRAIALKPDQAVAHNNRGAMLLGLKRHEEALACFDTALALEPSYAHAYSYRGCALHALGRYEEALRDHEQAVRHGPRQASFHYNRGLTLQKCRRLAEAIGCYEAATALDPGLVDAFNHRGLALYDLQRHEEALASLDRAVALNPGHADARSNRGMVLQVLERFPEALADLGMAVDIEPSIPYLLGDWLYNKKLLCDWSGLDDAHRRLAQALDDGQRVTTPFAMLSSPLGPEYQRACADICARADFPITPDPVWKGERYDHRRIRVGYLSSDLRNHAVAQLMAGVFEKHKRARFETYAFYFGPATSDPVHRRTREAFDHFLDVAGKTDTELAALVRECEIDIAIDLNGYTQNNRLGVFALRPAPIQVNYLGYPGGMGGGYMDYIIADRTVIPPEHRDHYSEKVVWLPHCYLPNDDGKPVSGRRFTRGEFGLPEQGFVFCSFNNTYKIDPEVFSIWMRLLRRVDGSVLWLSGANPGAKDNLRREAAARGVDPERLVFATRMESLADHLGRHRMADLFLDTFHYNAHTTASDALWAGLPVLTRLGGRFSGRVAASLLKALGLDELVSASAEGYEALALDLATRPERLAAMRETLAERLTTAPLFDTAAYTRQLEQAYLSMWERQRNGLPPEHIEVDGQVEIEATPAAPRLPPEQVEDLLRQAVSHQGAGNIAAAEGLYREILDVQPHHVGALVLLGICRHVQGHSDHALALMDQAIELDPNQANAHYNRGLALREMGRLDEAADSYGRALALQPGYVLALRNRGNVLGALDRFDAALADFDQALALKPDFAKAWFDRGELLRRMGRLEEAADSQRRAVQLDPRNPQILNNLGAVLHLLGRHGEARECFEQALRLDPTYAEAHGNLGMALHALRLYPEAIRHYQQALGLCQDYALAHYNLGISLREMGRHVDAVASYDRALAVQPELAEAHNNRGLALQELGHFEEALAAYERAIDLRSGYAEAHANRGVLLGLQGYHEDAMVAFAAAAERNPDIPCLRGQWLHTKMLLCEWDGLEPALAELRDAIHAGEVVTNPFPALSFPLDSPERGTCARRFSADRFPTPPRPLWTGEHWHHDRIRIAYVSSDFREHAVSYLLAGVIERHDRSRFEIYAFSTGAHPVDAMRTRLSHAFDHFIDLRGKNDDECALAIREAQADICVDLNGYTLGERTRLFSRRPAPIQVNYLGFPGSLGAPYIDYVLADRTVIPPEHRDHYSEKVVWLPHCFQPNDDGKPIAAATPSRAELGLPEAGFVFCCFNNSYKITPMVFDLWMALLRDLAGSVLWLAEPHPTATANLRREAVHRGVDPERLVFARRAPLPDYLARYRRADLFLDTFYYNAGTTASDALWAGLPVLTLLGDAFAGRMAASLLKAVGLPELITTSPEAYAALARELATRPDRLADLKRRLAANRDSQPLFDTVGYTRGLEAVYIRMVERHHAGLAPDHLEIPAV